MVNISSFMARPAEESQPEMQLIPSGTYDAVLVDSRMRESKNCKQYLQFEFKVMKGEFANRSIWTRYFIDDTGAAGQIARNQLQALENATGVIKPDDSSSWHDIPIQIVVRVRPAKGDYGPTNEITNFIRLTPTATLKVGGQSVTLTDDEPW
jgi:hypothetical protein